MRLNNKFRLLGIVLVAGVALTGCKKTWLDINRNPNSLPPTRPDFEFTSGIGRNAAVTGANEIGQYWAAQMTQSSTYAYSSANFAYNFNNTNFNFWDTWYDILEDFQYTINNADEFSLPALKGPSKIMQASIFQQLVDCYGNIPFSQALKAAGALAPTFDEQQAVYDGLITLIDAGIADIKANPFDAITSTADVIFKGGTAGATNWIKFANSLKLRILMRESNVAGKAAYIEAELNKILAAGDGFLATGVDVGANPGYVAATLGTTAQTNPFYDTWGYDPNALPRALGRFPRPTTYLFNALISTNDTLRLKRLFYPVGGESTSTPGAGVRAEIVSNYTAIPYGASSGFLSQNTSAIGPAIITRGTVNKPIYVMIAAESFFLLAEAKVKFPAVALPETAQTYYETAVKEHFRLTGAAASGATTVLTGGLDLADWNASPDKLKAIWQQKWIAFVHYNGFQAWNDYRQNNFPVIPPSAGTAANAPRPLRFYYPITELGSNSANISAQGTIDPFATKIFWDVN